MKKLGNYIFNLIKSKPFLISVLVLLVLVVLPMDVFAGSADEKPSIENMEKAYKQSCHGCKVLSILLSSFMTAASKTYEITSEIGRALLKIITPLTITFMLINQLRSFNKVEPADILKPVAILLFKVAVAWIVIGVGIGTLVSYVVTPLMNAGLDFGNALMTDSAVFNNPPISYKGNTSIISESTLNKLLAFVGNAENKIKSSFIVGSGLIEFGLVTDPWVSWGLIYIPDLLKILLGLFLWLVALLMSLSVSFYLMDIAVNLAMTIIFLPIAIGIWPFNITKGKISICVDTVLNTAGLFAFLAIFASIGTALIDQAYILAVKHNDGAQKLIEYFKQGKKEKIDEIMDLFSLGVLMILACIIYAYKLFEQAKKQNDRFFGDGFSMGNYMHEMATKVTEMGTKMAKAGMSKVGGKLKDKFKETKFYKKSSEIIKSKKADVVRWTKTNAVARGIQSARRFVKTEITSAFMNDTKVGRKIHTVASGAREISDRAKFAVNSKVQPVVDKVNKEVYKVAEKYQQGREKVYGATYKVDAAVAKGAKWVARKIKGK